MSTGVTDLPDTTNDPRAYWVTQQAVLEGEVGRFQVRLCGPSIAHCCVHVCAVARRGFRALPFRMYVGSPSAVLPSRASLRVATEKLLLRQPRYAQQVLSPFFFTFDVRRQIDTHACRFPRKSVAVNAFR